MVAQDRVTVIGGGIAGLVAAIACAQRGRAVILHEATSRLGGRARSASGPYRANYGPHALYGDGTFYAWMRREKLLPRLLRPSVPTLRTRIDGRVTRLPGALVSASLRLRGRPTADLDYRTWASGRASEPAVEAAIGFVLLPTFHHDPGELSAAFCHERFNRLVFHGHRVRYVAGGWNVLIERLAGRATELGVQIETRSRVTDLPERPVILAVPLSAARTLLPDRDLIAAGARTLIVDIAMSSPHRAPRVVFDLTERLYVTRVAGPDQSLAPAGEDLIQASAGLRPGESVEDAT